MCTSKFLYLNFPRSILEVRVFLLCQIAWTPKGLISAPRNNAQGDFYRRSPLLDINYWLDTAADQYDPIHHNTNIEFHRVKTNNRSNWSVLLPGLIFSLLSPHLIWMKLSSLIWKFLTFHDLLFLPLIFILDTFTVWESMRVRQSAKHTFNVIYYHFQFVNIMLIIPEGWVSCIPWHI